MVSSEFYLGKHRVGPETPPLIIAELSGNHGQSLARAMAMVDAAADCGAHAVKIQTYTADTITLDVEREEFRIPSSEGLWGGRSLHSLYEEAHTPWEWHAAIFERAAQRGISCFSSPFDETAVDFLETLDTPAYKIGSFENGHLPLIARAAETGKPMIISTGMATLAEIDEAVQCARDSGCQQLALLKCTSSYPAEAYESHILTIPHMSKLFRCPVGLSDHTLGIGAPIAAVANGACCIEKHFVLDRSSGAVDSAFSLEPAEFTQLVSETQRAWASLGKIPYGPTDAESASRKYRRSVYFAQDMSAGTALNQENIKVVRPGGGLHPRHYAALLGRRITKDVRRGDAVDWSSID